MKNGRKRLDVCKSGLHILTEETRRWKKYTRKDGTIALLSNGCYECGQAFNRKTQRQVRA